MVSNNRVQECSNYVHTPVSRRSSGPAWKYTWCCCCWDNAVNWNRLLRCLVARGTQPEGKVSLSLATLVAKSVLFFARPAEKVPRISWISIALEADLVFLRHYDRRPASENYDVICIGFFPSKWAVCCSVVVVKIRKYGDRLELL